MWRIIAFTSEYMLSVARVSWIMENEMKTTIYRSSPGYALTKMPQIPFGRE